MASANIVKALRRGRRKETSIYLQLVHDQPKQGLWYTLGLYYCVCARLSVTMLSGNKLAKERHKRVHTTLAWFYVWGFHKSTTFNSYSTRTKVASQYANQYCLTSTAFCQFCTVEASEVTTEGGCQISWCLKHYLLSKACKRLATRDDQRTPANQLLTCSCIIMDAKHT